MRTCALGIVIREEQLRGDGVQYFGGGYQPDLERLPSECPTCHRLFPLAEPSSFAERHPRSITLLCTREDDHPRVGDHWSQIGDVRVSFVLTQEQENGTWLANAERPERRAFCPDCGAELTWPLGQEKPWPCGPCNEGESS